MTINKSTQRCLLKKFQVISFLMAIAIGLLSTPSAKASQEIAKFYEGRVVNVTVGFNPGGGYDVYARILARHMGRHIPGQPTMTVQNMPGAGSLKAVRYLETTAVKDGTAISTFNPGLIVQSIVAPKKVDADFRKYAWLGSISEDIRMCFTWQTRKWENLKDLQSQKEMQFGGTSPGTLGYIEARIIKEYLKVPLRLIVGYPGGAEKRIAIESGELEGDCGGWVNVPDEWVKEKKIKVIVRFSPSLIPGLDKSMPYAGDLIEGKLKRDAFALLMAPEEIGRPFLMSAGVPAPRLAAMRTAFQAMLNDEEFLADAKRQRLTVTPMSAAQVEARLGKVYKSPSDVVSEARRISGED